MILVLGDSRPILGRGRWDADGLRDVVRDYLVENRATDGVLVIDETGSRPTQSHETSNQVGGNACLLATAPKAHGFMTGLTANSPIAENMTRRNRGHRRRHIRHPPPLRRTARPLPAYGGSFEQPAPARWQGYSFWSMGRDKPSGSPVQLLGKYRARSIKAWPRVDTQAGQGILRRRAPIYRFSGQDPELPDRRVRRL